MERAVVMSEQETERLLSLLVAACRKCVDHAATPQPGDLVVEVTSRRIDPDAIGFLIGEGEATWREDNTGPTRHVWDVRPLNPYAKLDKRGGQRWENALFAVLPASMAAIVKDDGRLAVEAVEQARLAWLRHRHRGGCREPVHG